MSTSFDAGSAPAVRWTPVAAWRRTRGQTASLSALSDRQLRDIGFRRDHATDRIVRRP
jgi:uncharacterized protein YjiS (DUF1127 family)